MLGPAAPPSAPLVFVLAWTVLGAIVGTAMLVPASRSMRETSVTTIAAVASVVATALAFAVVAARFGPSAALGPGTALAVIGPPLALVDLAERRLPSALLLPGFLLAGVAVLVLAAASRDPALIGAAVLTSATLTACYLALAVASAGGLGAGDVKLAALTGLLLAGTGWCSVLAATAATWILAALGAAVQRLRRHDRPDCGIPLGPYLAIGAILGALDLGSGSPFS